MTGKIWRNTTNTTSHLIYFYLGIQKSQDKALEAINFGKWLPEQLSQTLLQSYPERDSREA